MRAREARETALSVPTRFIIEKIYNRKGVSVDMGVLNKVKTIEMRVYEDPQNPDASNYDIVLPRTVSTEVINPVTKESVQQILDAMRGGLTYIGRVEVKTVNITQEILNEYAESLEIWPPGDGMTIVDGGDDAGANNHDWRYDVNKIGRAHV